MPLIILGLIVVLGACLLIYYQLGPKVTLRLKDKLSGFAGFGGFGGFDAEQPGTTDGVDGANESGGAPSDPGVAEVKSLRGESEGDALNNKKVLYVFGDGECEERSLRDNDGKDE